ncbi:MAG: cupredoxin domain-containing protein [Thermodesulfobacteriota bacterium]
MKRLFISFALLAFLLSAASRAKGEGEIVTAVVGSDGVQHVEILAESYLFKPDHIIVRINIPVELSVRKKGGITPHNIVIDAPESGIEIKKALAASPMALRFTPSKAGSYAYYCDKKLLFFKSHRAKGMEGVLEVRE